MEDMSTLTAALDDTSNPILARLASLNLPHNTYTHPLSATDKKHGLFLVTVASSTDVNTKELASLLKLDGKVNLRLADEELLLQKLGVKKGCLGPLAIMNNVDKDVTLVLDESLLAKVKVHSHPLRNDASVVLAPEDLMTFVRGYCEPVVVKFSEKMGGKVPSSRPEGEKGLRSLGLRRGRVVPLLPHVRQQRPPREGEGSRGRIRPEVAWVTKSGDGDLAAPIAVRPTSETIMYPAFADWIRSHRDLPLKLNQWSNVVRWEFKDPTPFLRTREFLWQEGHTAHASYEDADVMVRQALDLYRRVYEELLAIPVIPGYKTEKEKFAGGHQTTTVEAYIPVSGRAIQGATSHNLGQNFGKMFDINYQDEKGETQIAWQTSWGLTTRTIGVMVMVHGDDTGLILPPRVAPLQCVIVPIVSKTFPLENVAPYCEEILKSLEEKNIRCKLDDRSIYNPGWKYAHWEQRASPFVSSNMFAKAKEFRDSHLVQVTEWKDFVPNLELHNLVLTPWCGGEHTDWEEWVKEKSREESLQNRGEEGEDARAATSVAAKTLCIPFDQPEMDEG
eukprot:CCRYP_019757-RA/>CCRYP_019757-RA protein AED:0.29 eAED:0.29 QI:0/0/0/1/1/1/4/0/560